MNISLIQLKTKFRLSSRIAIIKDNVKKCLLLTAILNVFPKLQEYMHYLSTSECYIFRYWKKRKSIVFNLLKYNSVFSTVTFLMFAQRTRGKKITVQE